MLNLLSIPNIIKIGTNFSVGTKFARIYNLGKRLSFQSTIFAISMFGLLQVPHFIQISAHFSFETKFCKFLIFGQGHWFHWLSNFHKNKIYCNLRPSLPKLLISHQDPQFQISYLWSAMGIFFIFRTKFAWNEKIDTCFNVKCVLISRNFDFLVGYCSLLTGY